MYSELHQCPHCAAIWITADEVCYSCGFPDHHKIKHNDTQTMVKRGAELFDVLQEPPPDTPNISLLKIGNKPPQ